MIYILYFLIGLFALIGFVIVSYITLIYACHLHLKRKQKDVRYGACCECTNCGRFVQAGIPCRYCGY